MTKPQYERIFEGLEAFKNFCLVSDQSLFVDNAEVWTSANFDELYRRFNENPDESSASFVEKLTRQMAGVADPVLQLMAEILWLHFCGAGDVSGVKKREHINRVLGWMQHPVAMPEPLDQALETGPASTGVAFNTYRPQQLWFLINFGRAWKNCDSARVDKLLSDPWEFKAFVFALDVESAYLQRNALLHLLHPQTFEAIYSRSHKARITQSFAHLVPGGVDDIDRQIRVIADRLNQAPIPEGATESYSIFYRDDVVQRWNSKPESERIEGEGQTSEARRSYWLYSPGENAFDWQRQYEAGVMAIGWSDVGDLRRFNSAAEIGEAVDAIYASGGKNPYNTRLALSEIRFAAKPGDVVIAKRGRRLLLGAGIITGDYRFEINNDEHGHGHEVAVDWHTKGEWLVDHHLVVKTLTDIGKYPGYGAHLLGDMGTSPEDLLGDAVVAAESSDHVTAYALKDALDDLFMDQDDLGSMLSLLHTKKNLILTGPPGTGKTFIAERLAYLLAQERDPERVTRVQFHQSTSYEDFVQGYRPSASGFERRDGPFVRICYQAAQDERPQVLLIDEINRGNLSRIFGEAMMLIESDKRAEQWATQLAYAQGGEPAFWVPENVYIIGTMNTADRSLALVDYALRRRFAFFHIGPAVDHTGFHKHLRSNGLLAEEVDRLVAAIREVNDLIKDDANLGGGFCLGHSYFCALSNLDNDLPQLIEHELAPLLREYWFDDTERADAAVRIFERVV